MPSKSRVSRALSGDWLRMVKTSEDETQLEHEESRLIRMLTKTTEVSFPTGSSYDGEFNALGMIVNGTYRFLHGCEYEGGFEDGMFHGEGTLVYPMGQKLEGLWERGKMIAYKFSNIDGLEYEGNWKYCEMPDRRFNVSIREGLMPAGRELMTNQQPERPLEPACYDTGDGFYHPGTRSFIVSRDPDDYAGIPGENLIPIEDEEEEYWVNALRMVSETRHDWIIKNCRKGWDEPSGYRPEFYEDWITGRQKELDELDKKYADQSDSHEGSEDSKTQQYSFALSNDSAGSGRKLSPPNNAKIEGMPNTHF